MTVALEMACQNRISGSRNVTFQTLIFLSDLAEVEELHVTSKFDI